MECGSLAAVELKHKRVVSAGEERIDGWHCRVSNNTWKICGNNADWNVGVGLFLAFWNTTVI